MAANGVGNDGPPPAGGGDLPVPDLRTIEELCQPTLNGRGGPIAPINIQATNFGLKNNMIQQVQNSGQFHGLPGDDANKHLDKFLHITQSIKVNGVTDDALRLYIFPHSLTHHATACGNIETEVTKDTVPPTNNGSTEDVQPPVVQVQPQVPNSEPVVAPVSAPKPNPKPSIPYPSRLNDQKIREKANNQIEKFYQIFQDLHFDISFADALILMPKFASTLKSLISNKEKLFELARTPLNEHCSAVLLKKLPEKLRDPGKFPSLV
ncbi:hypothetical protein Tco_0852598 [Tanacetum coccineum]